MIRLAWIVLAAVTLYGCASSPDRQSPESFRVVGGAGLPIHGNFCGPNIPATRGRTEAEQLRELGGIAPQDDIDAQCKAHDMCYVRQPSRKVECDLALIDGVGALLERKRKTKREEEFDCDAVALSIIGYFQTANPAAVKNWADKFVGNTIGDRPRLISVKPPDYQPTEGAANRNPRCSKGGGGFAVCGALLCTSFGRRQRRLLLQH